MMNEAMNAAHLLVALPQSLLARPPTHLTLERECVSRFELHGQRQMRVMIRVRAD